MRTACALAFWLLMTAQSANGTPYRDCFVGITINKHPWGFWRVVDVPVDPEQRPYGFAAKREKVQFITYWCLGLGPYAKLQVSQGLGLSIAIMTVAFVAFKIYKRSIKTEPRATPNSGPVTPPRDSGVAEERPSVS